MGNKKISPLSIVLCVLAGLLAIYTVWCMINANGYIATQRVPFKGNEYSIINFYMSNGGQFGIYAIILFSLGFIMQSLSSQKDKIAMMSDTPSISPEDEVAEQIVDETAEEIQEDRSTEESAD